MTSEILKQEYYNPSEKPAVVKNAKSFRLPISIPLDQASKEELDEAFDKLAVEISQFENQINTKLEFPSFMKGRFYFHTRIAFVVDPKNRVDLSESENQ